MSTKQATPIRMCVGCGGRDIQSQLIRFTLEPEGALISGRGKGRGGYLHPRHKCVRAFTASRSGFVRSLRVVVSRETRERYVALLEHSLTLCP
jgi:predicted RNA-binding protein YlxR (DUF448 family)